MGGTEEEVKREEEKKEKEEKPKKEKKEKEKEGEKKKKEKKNPEDKKDPSKLRAKLEKLEVKIRDLAAKKDDILKLIQAAENNPESAATNELSPVKEESDN